VRALRTTALLLERNHIMIPSRLNRAVARATGETVREIRRRGFGPADLLNPEFDPEPDETSPQTVDWDELAEERYALFPAT
jgi:hypothetical protein